MPVNTKETVSPSSQTLPSPGLRSKQSALRIVGGKKTLNQLHANSAKVAKRNAPDRLQLALAITQRYFAYNSSADLKSPATANMSANERAHITYQLNNQDGPWAVAMSHDAFAWAKASPGDLAKLKTVLDFLNYVYGHLR